MDEVTVSWTCTVCGLVKGNMGRDGVCADCAYPAYDVRIIQVPVQQDGRTVYVEALEFVQI